MNATVAIAPSAVLPRAIKLGWAIGQFAIASHMAIISVYLMFYLTDVHGMPGTLAGTLVLIPRIWNIVTDPLMGGISDRWRSRWGRRRPFLLAGCVIWGLAFAAMFWIPGDFKQVQKATWFFVCYFVVNTGLSLYHVPYSAMAAEMTRDYDERLSLASYKEIAARVSVMLTIMASPLLVQRAPDALTGYRWVGMAAGGMIVLSGLVTFFATERAPAIAFQNQTLSWKEQFRTFRANRPLFVLSSAYLLSSASDAFYSAMLIYFITLSLGQSSELMGILYPLGSLTAIVMTAVWARVGVRQGKNRACILAFAAAAGTFLLSLTVSGSRAWMMFPLMVLIGASFSGVFLLPSAMVPDTVEYDERISGQRREGAIYGAWVFVQQTGMACGTFLVGVYLDAIGHRSGAALATPEEPLIIKLGFALVPAALLLAAIFIVRHYQLQRPDPTCR